MKLAILLLAIAPLAFVCSAADAETIGYGSRAGMEVSVVSKSGLDTDHAIIRTKHTRDNAIAFCRDYVGKITPKCIHDEMAVPLNSEIKADCITGTFEDFSGARFQFKGLNKPADQIEAKYIIIDLSTNKAEDGSEASGYDTDMDIFKALCPHHAPAGQ